MDAGDKPSIQNPNPKSTMASHFIKALANIHQATTTTTNSASSFGGRSRRINRAAYASMAISAGPRRAWSHALLQRLRAQRRRPRAIVIRRRRPRVSTRVERLRGLVPGGRSMDLCCLLEETASYMQCLKDQVTIMQSIVDSAAC